MIIARVTLRDPNRLYSLTIGRVHGSTRARVNQDEGAREHAGQDELRAAQLQPPVRAAGRKQLEQQDELSKLGP